MQLRPRNAEEALGKLALSRKVPLTERARAELAVDLLRDMMQSHELPSVRLGELLDLTTDEETTEWQRRLLNFHAANGGLTSVEARDFYTGICMITSKVFLGIKNIDPLRARTLVTTLLKGFEEEAGLSPGRTEKAMLAFITKGDGFNALQTLHGALGAGVHAFDMLHAREFLQLDRGSDRRDEVSEYIAEEVNQVLKDDPRRVSPCDVYAHLEEVLEHYFHHNFGKIADIIGRPAWR
jgi:hypothetical protein